jgi:tetratricopeptide (TPR) repeat protein
VALWVVLALLVLFSSPLVAAGLTVEDILAMAEAGVSEEILLDTIRRSGQKFDLTDPELARLRAAHAPEAVIRAMRGRPAKAQKERDRAESALQKEAERSGEDKARRKEEQRQERQQHQEEARKLEGKAITVEQTRTRTDVDRRIDDAYDDLDEGRHARAAVGFDTVVSAGLAAPNTARYVDAHYGLAEALARLGMPSAATPYLVEVLRHGPAAPRFDDSLRLLLKYARTVDFTHPIVEVLDTYDLSTRPQALKDEVGLLTGGYRARYGDYVQARERLSQITSVGPRGPSAAYRLGLVEVADGHPLEGLRAFERAVELAEKRRDAEVRALSYLALARLAYEVGRYDAAVDYYRRVPPDSASRPRARYELVWALLLQGDDRAALAALTVLEGERYADLQTQDLGVVEATAYLDLCHYEKARARAEAFLEVAAPSLTWLEEVVESEAKVAFARALERPSLRSVLLADVEVHVARTAALAALREETRLGELAPQLGPLATRLVPTLAGRRSSLEEQAATAALRRLRALRLELAELMVNADEVKVEADLAEKELLHGTVGKKERAASPERRSARTIPWGLDEERWLDEEDEMHSALVSQCPKEEP